MRLSWARLSSPLPSSWRSSSKRTSSACASSILSSSLRWLSERAWRLWSGAMRRTSSSRPSGREPFVEPWRCGCRRGEGARPRAVVTDTIYGSEGRVGRTPVPSIVWRPVVPNGRDRSHNGSRQPRPRWGHRRAEPTCTAVARDAMGNRTRVFRRDGERKRPEKSSSPAPSLSTTGVAAREAETTPISVRDAALREERGYRKNRVTRPRTQLLGLVTPDGGGTYSSRMERTSRRARSSILRAAFLRYHPYSTNERTIHVRLSSTVHHDAIFSSWRFLEFYFRASRGPYYSVMGSSRSWFLNSKAICVDRDGISIDDMNQFSLARSTPILSEIFRHSMNSTTFPLHKTAIMPNFFR